MAPGRVGGDEGLEVHETLLGGFDGCTKVLRLARQGVDLGGQLVPRAPGRDDPW